MEKATEEERKEAKIKLRENKNSNLLRGIGLIVVGVLTFPTGIQFLSILLIVFSAFFLFASFIGSKNDRV